MLKKISKFHKYFRFKTKIFIHFLFITLLGAILTYIFIWNYLEENITNSYLDKLVVSKELKKNQIENYYKNISNKIILLSNNPNTLRYTNNLLLNQNISKDNDYFLKNYTKINRLENLYIVDLQTSEIIYSAIDDDISNKSILNLDKNYTTIKNMYSSIKENPISSEVKLVDFEYIDSNTSVSYLSKVIFENNNPISLIIFKISINEINEIMTSNNKWFSKGYEKSGETYIVGDDCKLRNDSRFFKEDKKNYLKQIASNETSLEIIEKIKTYNTTILLQEIKHSICYDNGIKNTYFDYRGVEVLSVYSKIEVNGLKWTVLSEIDKDEALKTIKEIKAKLIIIMFVLFIILMLSTIVFSRNILKQLDLLEDSFESLANGDFTKKVKIYNYDEFGDLTQHFNKSVERLNTLNDAVKYYSKLSNIDNLTKLYNRRKIDEILDIEIQRYKRKPFDFSLIMFDIDFFKKINDNYGHSIGDYALVSLSKIIQNNTRSTDYVCRYGGEEFLIICVDTHLKEAVTLAEKLRKLIQEYSFDEFSKMTCSFGVTSMSKQDTKKDFLVRADKALYLAKDEGRNKVVSL